MGKPPTKPAGLKEKSTNSTLSPPMNVQRRKTSNGNSARRKALGDVRINSTDYIHDDEDAASFDTKIPASNSDMSGDDDEPQQSVVEPNSTPSSIRTRVFPVHEFADKISSNEYKCKLCLKTYRCSRGTNANIRRHLAQTHGKAKFFSKSQVPDTSAPLLPGRKKLVDEAAITANIVDSRSFRDFRQPGMQYFLRTAMPGYFGPDARTVQRNLKNSYNEKKKSLKEELASVQCVSFTADTWRCGRKRHYVCVTAHFITSTFIQRSTILSFRQFYGRSFAMRLRRHIRTVLIMFGLDKGKVYATTTDNGADMRKATQIMTVFGVRLHCVAHGLNLTVQKSLNLWPKPKRQTKELASTSAKNTRESDDDDDSGGEDDSDDDSTTSTGSDQSAGDEYERASADDADELDYDDDSSDSDDEETSLLDIQDVGILMAKSRKLINTIRKSSILNEAIRNLARDSTAVELIVDAKIRWNSSDKMIQRLLLHQQVLAAFYENLNTTDGVTFKQRKKLSEVKLTSVDWNILLPMRTVLERFNGATEILSDSSYPMLPVAYPVIYSLYNYLNDRSGDGTENALKDALVENFVVGYVLPDADAKKADLLFSAAFLDPLVRDKLSVEHRLKAEMFLQNAVKNCQKTTSSTYSAPMNASLSSMNTSSTMPSKSTTMLKSS